MSHTQYFAELRATRPGCPLYDSLARDLRPGAICGNEDAVFYVTVGEPEERENEVYLHVMFPDGGRSVRVFPAGHRLDVLATVPGSPEEVEG